MRCYNLSLFGNTKPDTQDKFRLTIDYRPVNDVMIPIAGPMPSSATTMRSFSDKKIFARFDFTQGFWQLPLQKDSGEIFLFVTPDGVYTPTQVLQGVIDSALHFQTKVLTKPAALIPHSALVAAVDFKLNMGKSSPFELEIL
ncbi:hypothetical protein PHMEG_00024578 [Phytophthora megakarya]|uniref:Reverse transcriptase domain-containing protein n=1 Tax=Phytophthora megakarya TaxID=4795 RepID=A0A225VE47_9STRA|nr:hypothetical protein PHMEG_00024578 [Phytophthora megakarya]